MKFSVRLAVVDFVDYTTISQQNKQIKHFFILPYTFQKLAWILIIIFSNRNLIFKAPSGSMWVSRSISSYILCSFRFIPLYIISAVQHNYTLFASYHHCKTGEGDPNWLILYLQSLVFWADHQSIVTLQNPMQSPSSRGASLSWRLLWRSCGGWPIMDGETAMVGVTSFRTFPPHLFS